MEWFRHYFQRPGPTQQTIIIPNDASATVTINTSGAGAAAGEKRKRSNADTGMSSPPVTIHTTSGPASPSMQKKLKVSARDVREQQSERLPSDEQKLALKTAKKAAATAAIRHPAKEWTPEYAKKDAEIRDQLWKIMDMMESFAEKKFSFKADEKRLDSVFASFDKEASLIITCIAGTGPSGEEGWREMFSSPKMRPALICGIIGNVLVEHVFSHMFFGGTKAQIQQIREIQNTYCHHDGFSRNAKYANLIATFCQTPNSSSQEPLALPANFQYHSEEIVLRLYTLLHPFLQLSPVYAPLPPHDHNGKGKGRAGDFALGTHQASTILSGLWKIVTRAGCVSHCMRLQDDAVYYFTPLHKDAEFESAEMEAYNDVEMQATNPRHRVWPAGTSEAEKRRARGDGPLVQIVCMNGCTVYRRGGFPDVVAEDGAQVQRDKVKGKGIRSRMLTQGWVFCRWGRQRLVQRGVKRDRKETHGEQWVEPGFVEFRELVAMYKKSGTPEGRLSRAETPGKRNSRKSHSVGSSGKRSSRGSRSAQ